MEWTQVIDEDPSRNIQKINPLAVPLRVPVRELVQKKTKEVNQEGTKMKRAPQSMPFTNVEPLRVPIV